MKKLIKTVAFGIACGFGSLTLLSFSSAETANAGADSEALITKGGGVIVTCPSGDWSKCYEFPDGGIVYKGYEGNTTIQF
jgi:hypothetical protein